MGDAECWMDGHLGSGWWINADVGWMVTGAEGWSDADVGWMVRASGSTTATCAARCESNVSHTERQCMPCSCESRQPYGTSREREQHCCAQVQCKLLPSVPVLAQYNHARAHAIV